eukprot:g5205.t1
MEHSSGLNYRLFDTVGASRRIKKRKTDVSEITSEFESLLADSEQLRKLREYERRLDTVISSRNIEVAETYCKVDRVQSVLRIYLWNEFTTAPSGLSKNVPFWKLKITGRLLSTKSKPGEVSQDLTEANFHTGMPLGYFLKSIEVKFEDEGIENRTSRIHWSKVNEDDEEKEVFEILRPGDKQHRLKIELTMDHQAPQFRLNNELARILGFEIGSRSKIITELWSYIRSKGLQSSSKDPGLITCNAELREIFGDDNMESIQLNKLSMKLDEVLTPADVVTLDYQLQTNGSAPVVYDIEMELPANANQLHKLPQFPKRQMHESEVMRLNQIIRDQSGKIAELKRRRHFFLGFSQSPTDFINALLIAQANEVRNVKRLGGRDCYKVETQTEFFKEKWVEDAVVKYFQRRLASGH